MADQTSSFGDPRAERDVVLCQIAGLRLVPVLVLDDPSVATPVGRALKAGGLPCAEVTLRTATAIDSIRRLARDADMLVGAGTVLSSRQVEEVVEAGARFVVSPGFDARVVRACQQLGVTVIPGVATATEIQMALEAGITVVKLFPAGAIGGVKTLRALSAPFPMVQFLPTGGIGSEDVTQYLEHPQTVAVGGSWMAPSDLISAGRFPEIAARVRDAVTAAQQIHRR